MSVLRIESASNIDIKDLLRAADYIAWVQRRDGEIPWSRWGKTDLWDHVESAMGLTVGGYLRQARNAYSWCREKQLSDGSWWSLLWRGRARKGAYKDSNMTAYVATGLYHYYIASGDKDFVASMWPMVQRAIDFVVSLQGPDGEIYWARNADGSVDKKALLAGSSSVYFSLGCAIRLSEIMGKRKTHWEKARCLLGRAISANQKVFDPSTKRYAMDWYYPILCGAVRGARALERIENGWKRFVIEGSGVRCVSDRPWVTMAETSELAITLAAVGMNDLASEVFGWISNMRYKNGAYWTGFTLPDCRIFTKEKTTWTAASTLLAADILYGITSASGLFSHLFWDNVCG